MGKLHLLIHKVLNIKHFYSTLLVGMGTLLVVKIKMALM